MSTGESLLQRKDIDIENGREPKNVGKIIREYIYIVYNQFEIQSKKNSRVVYGFFGGEGLGQKIDSCRQDCSRRGAEPTESIGQCWYVKILEKPRLAAQKSSSVFKNHKNPHFAKMGRRDR